MNGRWLGTWILKIMGSRMELYSPQKPGPRQAQYLGILLQLAWQSTVNKMCHEQRGHAKEGNTGNLSEIKLIHSS